MAFFSIPCIHGGRELIGTIPFSELRTVVVDPTTTMSRGLPPTVGTVVGQAKVLVGGYDLGWASC